MSPLLLGSIREPGQPKKIPGIPLRLAPALMTTVTKQAEGGGGGGGLDVKDIHPVNRALSLKLKQLSERLSSLLALWWAVTQYGALKAQRQALDVFSAVALQDSKTE